MGVYSTLLRISDAAGRVDLEQVRAILNKAIDEDAPDDLFIVKLSEKLKYTKQSSHIRTKYFFEMIDAHSAGNGHNKKRTKLLLNNGWHLEHIVPQNPLPGDPDLPFEDADSLGNLCLLSPNINQRLSNLNFVGKQAEAKRIRSEENESIEVSDSAQIFYESTSSEWTSQDVRTRINWLNGRAVSVFRA